MSAAPPTPIEAPRPCIKSLLAMPGMAGIIMLCGLEQTEQQASSLPEQ
jgi:hypothetical protein